MLSLAHRAALSATLAFASSTAYAEDSIKALPKASDLIRVAQAAPETAEPPQMSGESQPATAEAASSPDDPPPPDSLPAVVIEQERAPAPKPKSKPATAARPATTAPRIAVPVAASIPAQPGLPSAVDSLNQLEATPGAPVAPGTRSDSLTVPTTEEARAEMNQTPGGVALVPGTAYQSSTPAKTPKDILDFVPGVFAQTKWGEDTRLSIRGSGLSRNFHLRGVQLFMDGIPMNTSDGYGDFQEIDPTIYRYVEVFKGANALQYGANALGGGINFVMPSGYTADLFKARTDFGSFDFQKVALSSGAVAGPADYFIGGTWQTEEGFREHSAGESVRGSANVGVRITPDIETRFYFNANKIEQQIPGEVTKEVALTDPQQAAAINVTNNWQRNIDSVRMANKTALRLAPQTLLEFGFFGIDRHLMHPIFLWLDYKYRDYGGFARLVDDRFLGKFRNHFVSGVNVIAGNIDADLFAIGPDAVKGPLLQSANQNAQNESFYLENSFYFLPKVALVGGTQYLHAVRDQEAVFNTISGTSDFDLWMPKVGLLWDVDKTWQVFANISRSGEVPSFGEGGGLIPFTDIKAQTSTTYEVGTRGIRPDYNWDISLYHANVQNELQCLGDGSDFCTVVNAPRTIHQGLEFGLGLTLLKSIFVNALSTNPDRLWLNTAYTFNDFFFDNDPVFGDNELPGVPRHFIRSELLYKHPWGFFVGPNVEWVPEAYFVDNANTLDTEFYAIWGAKFGFERGIFTGYVEGRNLNDRKYIATTDIVALAQQDSPLFWPGNGRAVYAGLQIKW
jgi:iron complex outermembrane receptor protein